ncbi:hypothetical protein GXW71_06400 [Roseomonas hellenica]|uniref:Uncharacterized protein n=1 Tax=Plastoroseomonas hellenica TaxID=2687306 RepID=A0ABS5EUM8_9PROT|nr:hypothetical protein [Plastoroseomonas hellenica]MBR0663985.1 hypothetical protein [Plastoroseomonas hellenica]
MSSGPTSSPITRPWHEPRGELLRTAEVGEWGGPNYEYRGAKIRCNPGGHVCAFVLEGHPLSAKATHGVPGTITPIIDAWLDEGRLLSWYRVPKG